MIRWFLLFLLVLPLLDLYLLFRIAQSTNALWVLVWVVLTAVLGVRLARLEGFRVLARWQKDLALGKVPQDGVLSGLLVLSGGVLLVFPGPISDLLGLLLLLAPFRRLAASLLRRWALRKIKGGSLRVYSHQVRHVRQSDGARQDWENSGWSMESRDGSPVFRPRFSDSDSESESKSESEPGAREHPTIETQGYTVDEKPVDREWSERKGDEDKSAD